MLAMKDWLAAGRHLVYVARDDARMMAMRDAMARLIPSAPVHVFPAWDCLPYDRLSPQNALVGQRVETLARLAEGKGPDDGGALLVTTVNAILQRGPTPGYFADRSLILTAGDTSGPARLAEFLSGQGYLRTETVRETGEFALRGGILDIFPPGHDAPVRLDFFGDELETLRALMRQRSVAVRRLRSLSCGRWPSSSLMTRRWSGFVPAIARPSERWQAVMRCMNRCPPGACIPGLNIGCHCSTNHLQG